MPRAVALAYHAVTDVWPHPLATRPARLAAQLGGLAARGFRGVTLSELADGVEGPAVAVTFDDGFASVATAAKPVLDELGWPATVYLVTDLVGTGASMHHIGGDDDAYASERLPLSWGDVAQLAEAGWEIGSHTRTHRVLSTLSNADRRDELEGSRAAIVERVGGCRSISYPLGELDDGAIAAARTAGYTTGSGLAGRFRLGDPMAVPRVAVAGGDDAVRFGVKTSRAFQLVRTTPAWSLVDTIRLAVHA